MHHTIEVDHLSFSYPDGRQALRDVSLRIAPGEKVALVGPNGAGKSTLMLHLNGILAGQGSVCVCGLEVIPRNFGRIRAAVGLVFQSPDDQLFSPTVFDDVAFGPLNQGLSEPEVRKRVSEALAEVGAGHLEERPTYRLSGGEKRAAAIATVLAMLPDILILDEPGSGLDPYGRRLLVHMLRNFRHTRLIATHDLDLVLDVCPRTIVLHEGEVAADGPTAEIFRRPDLLERCRLEVPFRMQN